MIVEFDNAAQWVSLRNYQQINDRWYSIIRPYVVLRYQGEVGKQYITKMDQVIANKSKIEDIFKADLFIRFYFNTFYDNYTQQFEMNKILEFPMKNTATSYFKINCKLSRNFTDKGYKEIVQNGLGLTNFINTEESIEDENITYSARILLIPKTNYVREAIAEWDYKLLQKKIKLILYPLRHPCNDKFDIKIDKEEKKKSRLSRFFE